MRPVHAAEHEATIEVLEEGLARLAQDPFWEHWQWRPEGAVFNTADSFMYAVDM